MPDKDLMHFGVKGMRWGKRKTSSFAAPSDDFKNKSAIKAQAKTSGTKTCSNKQLQEAIMRMQLEQQYSSLNSKTTAKARGINAAKGTLAVAGFASSVYAFATSPMAKKVAEIVKTQMSKG